MQMTIVNFFFFFFLNPFSRFLWPTQVLLTVETDTDEGEEEADNGALLPPVHFSGAQTRPGWVIV